MYNIFKYTHIYIYIYKCILMHTHRYIYIYWKHFLGMAQGLCGEAPRFSSAQPKGDRTRGASSASYFWLIPTNHLPSGKLT